MITVHDRSGMKHMLSPAAIALISPTEVSSRWHGIRSTVRLHDGKVLECSDEVETISKQIDNDLPRVNVTLDRHQLKELFTLTGDSAITHVSLENVPGHGVTAYVRFDSKNVMPINLASQKDGE